MKRPVSFGSIRRRLVRYQSWLINQQWFQLKDSKIKQRWLEPLDRLAAAIEARQPAAMWEAAVDHWHETPWKNIESPTFMWGLVYRDVDELRTTLGVDSTN